MLTSRRDLSAIALARREAAAVQAAYPQLFESMPVRPSLVARAFSIRVEKSPTLRERAKLELNADLTPKRIVLRADVDPQVGRFALAHEIGHVMLLKRHGDALSSWDT